jgi:2-oxoglutarate/2-oxoacid ferredoxin oxidoreductase subunit alpha
VVQAEDELAAAGMVIGAGFAGARALTATSGPGISLMAEFTGLAYFAEVPAVIWNVQRVGPSTGMPTRTSQGDLAFTYTLGHGDTAHVVLLPSSIEECFEFGWRAFDLADELQTPVFVLSDLDLGMNTWMGEPFAYPDGPLRRGKVLSAEDVEAARLRALRGPRGRRHRLAHAAGQPAPAGGLLRPGHEPQRPRRVQRALGRLGREHGAPRAQARDGPARRAAPEIDAVPGARVGVIAFGTTRYALAEARDLMAKRGQQVASLRLKALPPSHAVRDFIAEHDVTVVLEMNHDAQLFGILAAEYPDLAPRLRSIAYLDGVPFTAGFVAERLQPFLASEEA